MSDLHFEPYIHLAGLTHDAALITWGGFYFPFDNRRKHPAWLLVDDGEDRRAFTDPGLFYTFGYGADVQLHTGHCPTQAMNVAVERGEDG